MHSNPGPIHALVCMGTLRFKVGNEEQILFLDDVVFQRNKCEKYQIGVLIMQTYLTEIHVN